MNSQPLCQTFSSLNVNLGDERIVSQTRLKTKLQKLHCHHNNSLFIGDESDYETTNLLGIIIALQRRCANNAQSMC